MIIKIDSAMSVWVLVKRIVEKDGSILATRIIYSLDNQILLWWLFYKEKINDNDFIQ